MQKIVHCEQFIPFSNVPFLRENIPQKRLANPIFVNHHMVDGHDRKYGHVYSGRWTLDWFKLYQIREMFFMFGIDSNDFVLFSEQSVLSTQTSANSIQTHFLHSFQYQSIRKNALVRPKFKLKMLLEYGIFWLLKGIRMHFGCWRLALKQSIHIISQENA